MADDTGASDWDDRLKGKGSDDDYCSLDRHDGHHYVSHSVEADPVVWVERCSVCGHISSSALRRQTTTRDLLIALQRRAAHHLEHEPRDDLRLAWAEFEQRVGFLLSTMPRFILESTGHADV